MAKRTAVKLSTEYRDKLNKLESLKNELAKLISERDNLENTVSKNLEALYAIKIGKNEYHLFKIECEVARLKRKIELFQAKINHGKRFDIQQVENQLNQEYKKWQEEISRMIKDIENSKNRLDNLMDREDSIELQKTYRELVKKLHPDVNPGQTEKEKLLWNRTIQAYNLGDLEELRTLKLLVSNTGNDDIAGNIPDIDRIIKSTSKKVFNLIDYIKKMKSKFPFTIEDKINDDTWVSNKNFKILKKIETLKKKKTGLKSIIDRLIIKNMEPPKSGTIN